MVQDFSLHTHTIGFDGRNTSAEMVARAEKLGFKSFGISNHFVVHPDITKTNFYPYAVKGGYDAIYCSSFDEAIAKFKPHYKEMKRLAEKSDMKLYCGMEMDFFDTYDWFAGFDRVSRELQPDYIICASHFIDNNGKLCNVCDIGKADAKTREEMLKAYWNKLARAGETGLFNWVAHIDLPRKVGVGNEDCWAEYERYAIDKIAASKTALEINTSGYDRGLTEPYPSSRILKMAAQKGVPVLLSDDAHGVEHIGRHFNRAMDFAKSCEIQKFLTCANVIGKIY
ncbi:MAG: histidinol-phosphatase HisJ family protein [Alphaproteobacteria bacterium]|nr:histidinol-phosphatase HisJ family protein [Alphaproteobacteria bacterium]